MDTVARLTLFAVALALAGCQSKAPIPESGALVGVVAWLGSSGSAASGSARAIERGDGVNLTVSMTNLAPGTYRLAFHQKTRCNTPYARSAGPAWAPPGAAKPADTFLPLLYVHDSSNSVLTMHVPGVRIDGPEGLRGRTFVVHWGSNIDVPFPGQPTSRIACGVFVDDRNLLERD